MRPINGVFVMLLTLSGVIEATVTSNGCVARTFSKSESFVCVCSSKQCDVIPSYEPLDRTMYTVFTSSNSSDRLAKRVYSVSKQSNITDSGIKFTIDTTVAYQSVTGFGGAFTDAASMNVFNLSSQVQELLIKSYFSTDGIEYTIGRIPMASCDFSTHEYSYDDSAGDFNLVNFSLAKEDNQYKIPMMKSAIQHSDREIKFFGSPWSAPGWMKTNGRMHGRGQLIGKPGEKYFKTWAQYFVKFVEEYAKNNITLWGVTVQNEPTDGEIPDFPFQAMHFSPEMERDFVKKDLGPALDSAGLGHLNVMMMDDQSLFLPEWPMMILSDHDAAKYISGIAIHWYLDHYLPFFERYTETHDLYKDKFLFYTEACYDSDFVGPAVDLGSWTRGEGYSKNIMDVMNHWVTGWTDWNLALNLKGGPNWVQNYVDSPIIVDAEKDAFYKQPMYYHLGHFSKFVVPGSVRVKVTEEHVGGTAKDVSSIAFSLPDGTVAFILLNTSEKPHYISIYNPAFVYLNAQIPARAIQTYLWKP